jgi:butyrate kinase
MASRKREPYLGPRKYAWKILAINPGSTSTKFSVFHNEQEIKAHAVAHTAHELSRFKSIIDQESFRSGIIAGGLRKDGFDLKDLHAVVARGGLLKPVPGGVFLVNERMLDDLRSCRYGIHASNLGALLAQGVALQAGCKAYIVDPVVVDELDEVARLTGLPEIKRRSIFHALNHKSVAREVAARMGKEYDQCNFIVAHLGGGITVGAHCRGSVIDVNNGLDGEGPFSPERSGKLPAADLAALCFSGKYTHDQIRKKIAGQGGLTAYRGSNSMQDLKKAVQDGDRQARLLFEALAYQVSREIASQSATLKGRIDRIILTGGLANDEDLVNCIKTRVGFLAPVEVIPGEREMLALAQGVLRVLNQTESAREYN